MSSGLGHFVVDFHIIIECKVVQCLLKNIPKEQSEISIIRHYKSNAKYYIWQGSTMWFKCLSFLFLVQKKKLAVNVGEKWNLLSHFINIENARQCCIYENINHSLFYQM